ncbi:MAG TPA: IS4 family transposase [Streptosporangiaceae bacterium]|nr:IS4 family transposase [Streptosporangiaceae bacterium]
MSAQSAMVTFTRAVTVAAGAFAPGHLGELTQLAPFELVDDILARTRTVQRRLRVLPSRVGVYFVLALGLFPQVGYARVWAKLTAGLGGLDGLDVAAPSEKALRDLRRRLGPAPLRALFEVLAGPLAWPHAPGVRFAGLRTVAFDGCSSIRAPDTARNRAWLGRVRHRTGFAGYPLVRLMALAETGTRGLLGAVIAGRGRGGETALARQLLHLLGPGMLVLADRAFDAAGFLAAVAGTGAHLLIRARSSRLPLVLEVLPDGSYLADIGGLSVRVIEARIRVQGADGTCCQDTCRLVTTLLDHRRAPADRLVRLYHERWEIESAYYALRHTLLAGRVLRSGDRPGAEQELWALLAGYQLLRMAMTDATATRPGTDPDRASFTIALQTAGEQLTTAQHISPATPDHPGPIGRAVLAGLLPARRPRYSARKVKSSTSRYPGRPADPRPALPATITAVTITITTPPPGDRSRPRPRRPRQPAPGTLRHRVTALLHADPARPRTGRELAALLRLRPSYLLSHLAHWTSAGHLTRTSPGTYTLPATPAPLTNPPDP